MTDKEQIMIDGCNVLKCRYYQYKTLKDCEMRYPESGDCEIGLLNYLFNGNLDIEKFCKDNPNCYFKQLTRKTQECEELKSESFTREELISLQEKDINRYHKALEEIKKHIESYKEQCNIPNNCVDNRLCSTCFLGGGNELGENILNIINKVKGEGNEG